MISEILLLEAQICVLRDLKDNWTFDSMNEFKCHLEWLWNDLEEIKSELLVKELKKEMTCLLEHKSNHTQYILS